MEIGLPLAYIASKRPIPGKKAFQKLAYFSRQLGLPVRCSFSMYLYGPYSNEVAVEYSEMVVAGLLKEDGHSLAKGPALESYLKGHADEVARYRETLGALERWFGDMPPWKLELYATAHFLATFAKRTGRLFGEIDAVREVCKAKGEKFRQEEIGEAFRDLVSWGLL